MSTIHVLYRMYDAHGALLYVGRTCNPHNRFRAHQIEKHWWLEVDTIKVENFESRPALVEAERIAIVAEKPRYNIKDTLTYGTYSLTEIAEQLGADQCLKHPERWVLSKMREIGYKGQRIEGELRFTKRQIQHLEDYQSSWNVLERRRAQRAARKAAAS